MSSDRVVPLTALGVTDEMSTFGPGPEDEPQSAVSSIDLRRQRLGTHVRSLAADPVEERRRRPRLQREVRDLRATLAARETDGPAGGAGSGATVGSTRCPVDVGQHLRGVAARLPQTRAALEYAERKHAGQRRGDGTAFIEHPTEVGWLLYRNGARDHVIAAGVLHDVLEKTSVSVGELDARFGSDIARLVSAVSEDVRIDGYRQRKAALRHEAAAAGERR